MTYRGGFHTCFCLTQVYHFSLGSRSEMTNITNSSVVIHQNETNLSKLMTLTEDHIPSNIFSMFMEYTSYVMICAATFGLAGNVLIIITYTKIGFSESINISYFALGISDILCVIFLSWNAICFLPAFSAGNVPFKPLEFVIPTGGFTSDIFQKTTAWITAFISFERCLCVVFPLKIKAIVKRRRTVGVIVIIFVLTVLPLAGITFYTYEFELRLDDVKNKSLVRVKYRDSVLSQTLTNVSLIYKVVFLNSIPFAIILVCAAVLAVNLKRSAAWRLGMTGKAYIETGKSSQTDDKAQRKYAKDIRVAKTVLTIGLTFIILGTLSTLRYLIVFFWSDFHASGAHAKLFKVIARLMFLLSLANSSVNFIIYYKMGTKFRITINNMLFGKS